MIEYSPTDEADFIDGFTLADFNGSILLEKVLDDPIDRSALSNALIIRLADLYFMPRLCVRLIWQVRITYEVQSKIDAATTTERITCTTALASSSPQAKTYQRKRFAKVTVVFVNRWDEEDDEGEEEDEGACWVCGDPCIDADIQSSRVDSCLLCQLCYVCKRCSVQTKRGWKCLACIGAEELKVCDARVRRRAAAID